MKKIIAIVLLLFISSLLLSSPPQWEVITGTEYSMVLMANINLIGNEFQGTGNNMAGAFGPDHSSTSNDCRSIAVWEEPNPPYWEGFWYFTIVGDTTNQEIHFRLYDESTDEVYTCNETIQFENNITIGSPQSPFSLTAGSGNYGEVTGEVVLSGGSGNITEVTISSDSYSTHPNSSGSYTLNLPQGNYDLTAELNGYYSQTINDVEIITGQITSDIDFILYPDNEELISVPSYTTALIDSNFTIPIELYNPDSLAIEGITFSLEFDSLVISYNSSSFNNTILDNMNYSFIDNSTSGNFSCWIYSNSTPVNSSGNILFINFDVNATSSDTSGIIFTEAQLNENPITTSDGIVEIIGGYNISGNINYYEGDIPIADVNIYLETQKHITTTNINGEYQFTGISPGIYYSWCEKSNQLGGLSSMDASRIARYGIGLIDFSAAQIIAADATQNSYVSPTDASRVARYGIGLIDSLNNSNTNWVFVSDSLNSNNWPPINYSSTQFYDPLECNHFDENFTGIRLGDVTGNWTGVKGKSEKLNKEITAVLPHSEVQPLDTITVAVDVFAMQDMEGMDIKIGFDEQIVDAVDATLDGGILENEDFGFQVNTNNNNEIILWIYTLGSPYTGGGTVANLKFLAHGSVGDSTALTFTQFMFNENSYINNTTNGSIVINNTAADQNYQNSNQTRIYRNSPNPFSQKTEISYTLKHETDLNITVYNIKGQKIEVIESSHKKPGNYTANWNAKSFPAGLYFIQLSTAKHCDIKKLILIR